MHARDAVKAAIKQDFVPLLREAGFTGTYPEWRLTKGDDVVVVRLAIGGYPEDGYAEFSVLLSVIPSSWWDWTHDSGTSELFGSTSTRGREHAYDGFSFVLDPQGVRWRSDHDWKVTSPKSAAAASAQMTAALQRHGLAQVLDLLSPESLVDLVESDDVFLSSSVTGAVWERDVVTAVLLADVGGPRLDEARGRLNAYDSGRESSATPLHTAAWLERRRAAQPE